MNELWIRIREARKAAGLTQPQLAKLCSVERASVSQWESVKPKGRTTPAIAKLEVVAKATGKPLWWFFTTEREPGPDDQEAQLVEMLAGIDDLSVVRDWIGANLSNQAKMALSIGLLSDVEKCL